MNATFVVTTGQGASNGNGFPSEAIPSNVWIGDYVPQSLLLPLCDVVLSHAGSGALTGAMSHGIPQLCLPQGADQFRNADALVKCGAGLTLEREAVNESSVLIAMQRLVDEASFGQGALRLKDEIAVMPTPCEVVLHLETI